MRIAHVVWGMETGGVETMLVNIINEQVKTDKIARLSKWSCRFQNYHLLSSL